MRKITKRFTDICTSVEIKSSYLCNASFSDEIYLQANIFCFFLPSSKWLTSSLGSSRTVGRSGYLTFHKRKPKIMWPIVDLPRVFHKVLGKLDQTYVDERGLFHKHYPQHFMNRGGGAWFHKRLGNATIQTEAINRWFEVSPSNLLKDGAVILIPPDEDLWHGS